jgi:hypothetical protein
VAVLNRLIWALLGLAVAAVGVILVVETVTAAVRQPPLLVDRSLVDSTLTDLSWTDAAVDIAIASLIGLGLLLLLLGLIPRPPDTLPLRSGEGRQAEIERKPLASLLAARAQADREVLHAKAKVSQRAAVVSVKAQPGADVRALRDRVTRMVSGTLEPLQLAGSVRPKVSVSRSRERSS